jgi:hypothetical protein
LDDYDVGALATMEVTIAVDNDAGTTSVKVKEDEVKRLWR